MALELSYAFTIFFLTLGPIKTLPAFEVITGDLDGPARRWLAIRSTLLATVIVLATALIFQGVMTKWRVSGPAMQIAGSVLLFLSASSAIASRPGQDAASRLSPPAPPKALDAEARSRAVSPLAIPTIVTPVGIAAILVFEDAAAGDATLLEAIYGMLVLLMGLNLLSMLFARATMTLIGLSTFRVLGWIMSVLQAGLAVQFVLNALRTLKIVPA
jgi:multiple antibiotic resistance protein